MSYRKRGNGFTLIELVIVISLVGVLANELIKRVLFYREMAERAAVQQVVGTLQTALIMQFGHRMASGTGTDLSNISNENPMNWLVQKPANYAGEFDTVNPAVIEPGSWVFDKGQRELVYLLNYGEYFMPAKNGARRIRYRTRLIYEPGYRNKKVMVFAGVTISPVETYQWLIREKE